MGYISTLLLLKLAGMGMWMLLELVLELVELESMEMQLIILGPPLILAVVVLVIPHAMSALEVLVTSV